MKLIPLTQGLFAMIDDEDFESISSVKWCASKTGNNLYALRSETVNGRRVVLKMHRVIVGHAASSLYVDHIDGNGLNNQRGNLRACTCSENLCNQRLRKNNSTGFKGVTLPTELRDSSKPFRAALRFKGKHYFLGYYESAEQAHAAYCAAASKIHGEFARYG